MISRRSLFAVVALLASAASATALETQAFTKDAFGAAQAAGKPIVVHVYAPWCPTCRAQELVLQKLEADPKYSALTSFRVDFDSQKDAVRALKATNQSTIVVFKGAKEIGRSVGETSEAAISALLGKAL
jgi:thiol-disulfide isomerase/thioredoxin